MGGPEGLGRWFVRFTASGLSVPFLSWAHWGQWQTPASRGEGLYLALGGLGAVDPVCCLLLPMAFGAGTRALGWGV